MKDVTAVILGGGRGTRLFPLTIERAKPALSFLGKYRLIDIPVSNCIHSGINRIFVLTQFMSASLHRHIMQTYRFDAFSNGFVDILAAEQTASAADWFQGTADAVRATLKHTTYYQFEQMLILSGDHLYNMNYSDLIGYHRMTGADITIAASPVPMSEASRYGLINVDRRGAVKAFAEKPKDPETLKQFRADPGHFAPYGRTFEGDRCLANMGVYVFQPDILLKALENKNETDFGREVLLNAINKFKVMAYPFSGYWRDIGTVPSFFEANLSLAGSNPPIDLFSPRRPFFTNAQPLPPSRINQTNVQNTLINTGCDISAEKISNSVIGERSIVEKGAKLDSVVMLGADFYEGEQVLTKWTSSKGAIPPMGIGSNCSITNAIIDRNARIGDNVTINRQKSGTEIKNDNFWIRDGITIIPSGAVIPSGTVI
ncbi:MAG: glucose-1-phosphate adenylyltransferase [Fibrobacteres bacterium]|nr:glucose-1-phosphate adenylyltransferase [Fibrobacterota bacterium]